MPEREDELTAVTPAEDFQFRGIADPAGTPVSVRGGAWADLLKTAGDTMTGQLELDHGGGYHLVIRQPFGPVDQRRVTWNLGSSGRLVLRLADDADLTRVVPFAVEPDGKSTFGGDLTISKDDSASLDLDIANGPANERRFRLWAGSADGLWLIASDDAGVVTQAFVRFRRSSGVATFFGPVEVPDATADGQALAYGQDGAELGDMLVKKDWAYYDLWSPQAGADQRRFRIITGNGLLYIQGLTDAGAGISEPFKLSSAGAVDLTGATAVTVPDATADGQALAYGQAGGELDGIVSRSFIRAEIDGNPAITARLLGAALGTAYHDWMNAAGQRVADWRYVGANGRVQLVVWDARQGASTTATVISVETDNTLDMTGASAVTVPAAADGDTTTAARTTAFDSTTGRVAVNGAEIGDTGWRDVSADAEAAVTAGTIKLMREGSRVSLHFYDMAVSSLTTFYVPPAGFRPKPTSFGYYSYEKSVRALTTTVEAWVRNAGTGGWALALKSGSHSPTDTFRGVAEYWTDDAWPATLPGTPA